MIRLTLYVRPRCSLCEEALEAVEEVRFGLVSSIETRLDIVDITTDEALRQRYRHDVPVLSIDGVDAFRHRVDEASLEAQLRSRAA